MTYDVQHLLAAFEYRVKNSPSKPFLTQYQFDAHGSLQRTELSAKSFANWVDKTANWLTENTLDNHVKLTLLNQNFSQWMTLVWVLAVWQAGLKITTTNTSSLTVLGPTDPLDPDAQINMRCSFHPLGLPLHKNDLAGADDFSDSVRAEPDIHIVTPGFEELEIDQDKISIRTPIDTTIHSVAKTYRHHLTDEFLPIIYGSGSLLLTPGVSGNQLTRILDQEKISG